MDLNKRVALYCRVSTDEQNTEMQKRELEAYANLRKWQIVKTYEDKGFSGATTVRPAFKEMLSEARRRKFDVILVWKLDRFSRSLKDLIFTLDELKAIGIEFCSWKDNLDFTTPAGKMAAHMLGVFVEFERDTIVSRVKAGLENAKAKGVRLGRPSVRNNSQVRTLAAEGKSQRQIAKKLGISKGSVQNALRGWTKNPSNSQDVRH